MPNDNSQTNLSLHTKAALSYDDDAQVLLLELTPQPAFQNPPGSFKPNIQPVVNFKSDDIHGWEDKLTDASGNETAKFFRHEDKSLGFEGEAYKKMLRLCERIQSSKGVRDVVSLNFVTTKFFEWVTGRYANTTSATATEFVLKKCNEAVREYEILLPIGLTMIESEITIGRVTIKEFSSAMFDSWVETINSWGLPPDKEQGAISLWLSRRGKLQGWAVACTSVFAEQTRAFEIALEETELALSMLRLFSPANYLPGVTSYCAPLGKENVDQFHYFVRRAQDYFSESSGIFSKADVMTRLSDEAVAMARQSGLNMIIDLIEEKNRSEFQSSLLESLVLYSRHTLARSLPDKLIALFAALDSFLLKDDTENIQTNLGKRIAFTIGKNIPERMTIIEKT